MRLGICLPASASQTSKIEPSAVAGNKHNTAHTTALLAVHRCADMRPSMLVLVTSAVRSPTQ